MALEIVIARGELDAALVEPVQLGREVLGQLADARVERRDLVLEVRDDLRRRVGALEAQLGARFIDSLVLLLPSGGAIAPEDNPPLPIDSFVYLDLYFGYQINDSIKVSLTGTNLTDEQPPMLYQNNVTNANTDVNTYDTLGRRYAVSATYKF